MNEEIKVTCLAVTRNHWNLEEVLLGHPDGVEAGQTWAKATLQISDPAHQGQFTPGREYLLRVQVAPAVADTATYPYPEEDEGSAKIVFGTKDWEPETFNKPCWETYGGQRVFIDTKGEFIWNTDGPRRKNRLGSAAQPRVLVPLTDEEWEAVKHQFTTDTF